MRKVIATCEMFATQGTFPRSEATRKEKPMQRLGILGVVAVASGVLLWPLSTATATPPDASATPTSPAPFVQTFLPGSACTFGLQVDGSGGLRVDRTTKAAVISAGTGSDLTFTNLASGKTLNTTSNGAVSRTTDGPSGTTVELLGHNVLILFPTDRPAGPSTQLIVGRAVFTVDSDGVFVVRSISGNVTDICAALA